MLKMQMRVFADAGLVAFIRATGTAFPPDMPSSHPCSPVSMVFPSSPIGPAPVDLLAFSPPRLFRFSTVMAVGFIFLYVQKGFLAFTVVLLYFVNRMFGDVLSI